MVKIISILVLLPVLLFGYSDTCELSTQIKSNTYYYLTQNFYSNIDIGDYDNICIDLSGDTLFFEDGNAIRIGWGANDIIIKNGAIIHLDSADFARCIKMSTNGSGFIVDSVDMIIRGSNGKCVEMEGNIKEVLIRNSVIKSYVNSFNSRCTYDAAVIDLESESALSGLIVENCYIEGPHVCINVSGQRDDRPLVSIYNNILKSDARNDKYPVPDGNSCHSSGNAFVINTWRIAEGSEIYNNVVLSGNQYGGGYGFLLQGLRGTQEKPIKIYNNIMDVTDRGIYMRALIEEDRTDLYNTYVEIFDNDIKSGLEGCRIALGSGTDDIYFCNNYIDGAMVIGKPDSVGMEYITRNTNHVFKNNYFKELWFGITAIHELAANNILLENDTIGKIIFTSRGTYADHSIGNVLKNCVFLNDSLNWGNYEGDGLGKSIRYIKTVVSNYDIYNSYGKLCKGDISYWYRSLDGDSIFNPFYTFINGEKREFEINETTDTISFGRLCGDVNLDGRVNVSDASYLLNYIFHNGPPPCKPE